MRNSIFFKILVSYVLVVIIAISVIMSLQAFLTKNYLMENKEKELLVRGRELAVIVGPILVKGQDPRPVIVSFNQADRILGTEFWVIDQKGKVLAASADHLYCEGNTLESADLEQLKRGHVGLKRGQSQYFKEAVIRVVTPVLDNGKLLGAVVLYAPVAGVNEASLKMRHIYIGAAFLGVIVSIALGLVLSRYITRSLREVSVAAGKIAEGDFDQRVDTKTEDEFGKLGQSINNMTRRLADSERMRKDFIANVSHELRSPLTSIQGFIDALLDGRHTDREESKKYLTIIQKETYRLSKLINDLLEISKFDSQGVQFNMEPFPLNTVINRAIVSLKPRLDEKNIIVKTAIPLDLPLCDGDEDRIEQVIHNLLSNAIHYSPVEGKILISGFLRENEIQVEVADNGPGIPAEELPKVWERFYRVDKDRSRRKGGTGLGLAIVREIIKKHGGRVIAESEQGEGAVFGFTLPLAVSEDL